MAKKKKEKVDHYPIKKRTTPFGRPREHDREKIADELLEWAKLDDSINLNAFCCTREPPLPPSRLGEFSRECPYFLAAYESAKAFLGARRERKLADNTLHVKAYDLNATTYDYFLKQERRAQAEFEASLKDNSEIKASPEEINRAMALMNQISKAQSAFKMDDKISKADAKSALDTEE